MPKKKIETRQKMDRTFKDRSKEPGIERDFKEANRYGHPLTDKDRYQEYLKGDGKKGIYKNIHPDLDNTVAMEFIGGRSPSNDDKDRPQTNAHRRSVAKWKDDSTSSAKESQKKLEKSLKLDKWKGAYGRD